MDKLVEVLLKEMINVLAENEELKQLNACLEMDLEELKRENRSRRAGAFVPFRD